MSTLTLTITSPPPGTQVPVSRQVTVSGEFKIRASPGHSLRSRSVSAILGVGPKVSGEVTGTMAAGTWSVTGTLLPAIAPNATFTVSVLGSATLRFNHTPNEPDIEDIAAEASIVLRGPPPRRPQLEITSVTPASPITTDAFPVDVRFAGTAVGVDAPIFIVQWGIDDGVTGQPIPAAEKDSPGWATWSQTLPMPPGQHTFMARAEDFFLTGTGEKTVTVDLRRETTSPPPVTLDGAPTTASITSWTRLEPRMDASDLGASSGARVFDPLWMLARQWQMGEFQGEDAGSPVLARVRSTHGKLSRVQLGAVPSTAVSARSYDAGRVPLEPMVERRKMRAADSNDPRMLSFAIDAGLHFAHMLDAKGVPVKYRSEFVQKFTLLDVTPAAGSVLDAATLRYVQSMVHRAPDGRRLAEILRVGAVGLSMLDLALEVADADKTRVHEVATAWLAWYDVAFSEPAGEGDDAWNPSRLEYSVSVGTRLSAAATDEITLAADEIDGSSLDWSSFDIANGVSLGTASDACFSQAVEASVPAPVNFAGLPAARFWEMEDARIAYGLVPVGPTDIAQLLMVEYASSYGNDWFIVPMTTPVGSITRVDSLVVTDSFGVRNLIRPIGDPALPAPHFSMWQPSIAGGPTHAVNRFFLPPTIPRTLDSGPLEEVMLMRDEMANVAWAIEHTVENPLEWPTIRYENRDAALPPQPVLSTLPRYVLSTSVPINWIPLLPVQADPAAANPKLSRLRRGRVLQTSGQPSQSVGDLLSSSSELVLYDEEVPREGVRLTRQRRMTRWTDGSTWVWTSFRNQVGRGEGKSGLEFDRVIEPGD